MPVRCVFLLLCCAAAAPGQLTPKQKSANLQSFELVWSTVRDRHPDAGLNGLNWQTVHDQTMPLIQSAGSMDAVRDILREMLAKLNSSHYAIIPGDLYAPAADSSAAITPVPIDGKAVAGSIEPHSPPARAGLPDENGAARHIGVEQAQPRGKLVNFGNLPPSRLVFESRMLTGGAGYIHFNEFLDPVSLMPQFEAAVKEFSSEPGIVLDLRGNPGGIGVMAMGIAGFFIDKAGEKLGEMTMRDTTLKFVVFPRAETYRGKLAILLDAGSASTTEILAQGLQDLKRARIFGSRSAGAALPSDIVRLPNGDGFQFAQASYTSVNGKVLEGAGVTPDVEVEQTQQALAAGRDLVVQAAEAWIAE